MTSAGLATSSAHASFSSAVLRYLPFIRNVCPFTLTASKVTGTPLEWIVAFKTATPGCILRSSITADSRLVCRGGKVQRRFLRILSLGSGVRWNKFGPSVIVDNTHLAQPLLKHHQAE